MSGQHIIIEQLREELEKAHAASEYQTRRIEHYRTQLDFCERRAEKAERFIATADSEWKVRAEKAERERDEWKARHDTLADVSRKCIATAERERDAARAEREALRRHYDEAGPEHNLLALLDLYDERRAAAESERDEALAERDARPALATLPTEFVAGEWIMSGQAEPDAVVTYTREPGPETGHVGWCWWARGKMGESRDYMAARGAAEHSLIAHAAKVKP